jgi:bifunctional DNA-binding transcriptional regulator/antitoxin component of YhaV-PrlF toxin-antitoxin module
VIPKQVRVAHGWEPGLEFVIEDVGDGIKLKPVKPYKETRIEEVLGCVNYAGPKKSLEDMEAAIAKGAKEKL